MAADASPTPTVTTRPAAAVDRVRTDHRDIRLMSEMVADRFAESAHAVLTLPERHGRRISTSVVLQSVSAVGGPSCATLVLHRSAGVGVASRRWRAIGPKAGGLPDAGSGWSTSPPLRGAGRRPR